MVTLHSKRKWCVAKYVVVGSYVRVGAVVADEEPDAFHRWADHSIEWGASSIVLMVDHPRVTPGEQLGKAVTVILPSSYVKGSVPVPIDNPDVRAFVLQEEIHHRRVASLQCPH